MTSSPANRTPSWRSRPGRFFARVAIAALALAALERGAANLYGLFAEPGRGASWIWAAGVSESVDPVAFWAVRDFDLDAVAPAWLAIVADEEWVAWVNGRRVGSGIYRSAAAADLYEVTDLLEPGGNRIAVELRSSRGAGGLLATLRLGSPESVALRSDEDWRIVRRGQPGIVRGWALDGGEVPVVWRRHPTGRWRPRPPVLRPRPPLVFPPATPRLPLRARGPWTPETWVDLAPFVARHRFPDLGPRVVLDWGEAVTGHLRLDLAATDVGLVFFGLEPPAGDEPPADALVVPVPGDGEWIDAYPRTFRYVHLLGVELAAAPALEPLARDLAAALGPPPAMPTGVFGVTPPRTHTVAEENVRLRLTREEEAGAKREDAGEKP